MLHISSSGALEGADEATELATSVLPHCARLEDLSLALNDVGDRGTAALAQTGSPTLTSLDLSSCGIGDAGFEALSAALGAGRFPKLTRLHANQNPAAAADAAGHTGSLAGRAALVAACQAANVELHLGTAVGAPPVVQRERGSKP